MNPSVGSFTVDPRLHRHFVTFAINPPNNEAQQAIFSFWLQKHFGNPNFNPNFLNLAPILVHASATLHQKLSSTLQPTASKFLYGFNIRDISSVFKGIIAHCSHYLDFDLSIEYKYK